MNEAIGSRSSPGSISQDAHELPVIRLGIDYSPGNAQKARMGEA